MKLVFWNQLMFWKWMVPTTDSVDVIASKRTKNWAWKQFYAACARPHPKFYGYI